MGPMTSAVCLSAIVDRVMPIEGGEILLTKGPGLASYTGNDVGIAASISASDEQGEAFHAYATDTINLGLALPEEHSLSCSSTFHSLDMKQLGTSIGVACPGDCMSSGQIIGTTVYTPNSNVCRAARHAGIIGSDGGHAMVTL